MYFAFQFCFIVDALYISLLSFYVSSDDTSHQIHSFTVFCLENLSYFHTQTVIFPWKLWYLRRGISNPTGPDRTLILVSVFI